jgi:hypothetical protein
MNNGIPLNAAATPVREHRSATDALAARLGFSARSVAVWQAAD